MADTPYVKEDSVIPTAVATPYSEGGAVPPYSDPYGGTGGVEDPYSTSGQSFGDKAGGKGIVDKLGGNLVIVTACSLILMVQASIDWSSNGLRYNNETAYAISVGTISLFFCLGFLLLMRFSAHSLPEGAMMFLSACLFVWWTVGACVLTFDEPYVATSNGYFSLWAGVFASGSLLQAAGRIGCFNTCEAAVFRSWVDRMKSFHENSRLLTTLAFFSVVELIAAIKPCASYVCQDENAFAIALGCVSVFFTMLLVLATNAAQVSKFVAIFLSTWWFFGAAVVTFKGQCVISCLPIFHTSPFIVTGNGYFATWGAFISAAFYLQAELQ